MVCVLHVNTVVSRQTGQERLQLVNCGAQRECGALPKLRSTDGHQGPRSRGTRPGPPRRPGRASSPGTHVVRGKQGPRQASPCLSHQDTVTAFSGEGCPLVQEGPGQTAAGGDASYQHTGPTQEGQVGERLPLESHVCVALASARVSPAP